MQILSEKAATLTDLDERDIFDTLLEREKLGSTGVGGGVAIAVITLAIRTRQRPKAQKVFVFG